MTSAATGPHHANLAQADYWTHRAGPIWVQQHQLFETMLEPFGQAALNALSVTSDEHIIDIGCGVGVTTAQLGEAVGIRGRVLGVDISPVMIEAAISRTQGEQTSFLVADAQTSQLGPVDALFSRFGVMFFDDPVAAFTNLGGWLRPQGRIAFICWRHEDLNRWMSGPAQIVRHHTPIPTEIAAEAPGPFAFRDADRVRSILTQANWRSIRIDAFEAPVVMGAGLGLDAALEQAMGQNYSVVLRGQVDDATYDHVRGLVRQWLRDHLHNGIVVVPGAAWVVTARRT